MATLTRRSMKWPMVQHFNVHRERRSGSIQSQWYIYNIIMNILSANHTFSYNSSQAVSYTFPEQFTMKSWVEGTIYYEASITAQGLSEPSSLWGATLGTNAAEHKGCNWSMKIDWWLQPSAVFGHSFSGISWHMPHKWSQFNCMTLSKGLAKR